eukprot:128738_1
MLASLKVNNKGWDIGIFRGQHLLKSCVCPQCHGACCEAVELGCDHDDNDIFLFCHLCLKQLVKDNDNKWPIDQHNEPIISCDKISSEKIAQIAKDNNNWKNIDEENAQPFARSGAVPLL